MSHTPKQRALEAYAANQLSAEGQRRVASHLLGCASCQGTLEAIRAYRELRELAAEQPIPELSWERLEGALTQDGSSQGGMSPVPSRAQKQAKLVALLWPALAVAATVLIAWIGLSGRTEPQLARRAEQSSDATAPSRPVEAVDRLVGAIMLVSGHVAIEQHGQRAPVTLATRVVEGSTLITETGSEVHVALRGGTGFVVGSESRLSLSEARAQRVQLELHTGTVHQRVSKLSPEQRYEVRSGGFAARVRGTQFTVEHRAAFRVIVHEGMVEVSKDGQVVALLSPGENYQHPRAPTDAALPAPVAVHGLTLDPALLAAVELPAIHEVAAWRFDGGRQPSIGTLAVRLPKGVQQLTVEELRGRVRTLEIEVPESGIVVSPEALAKLLGPRAPAVGHLESDEIRTVINQALTPLRRCYERALRTSPDLTGKLRLAVRVAPDGHVARAETVAQDEGTTQLPAALSRCIVDETSRLRFPRPEGNGYVSFEVPLNLRMRSGH